MDHPKARSLSLPTFGRIALGVIGTAHLLLYVSVYGAGLRFHSLHGRWPVAMIDQPLISRDIVLSNLETAFRLALPLVLLSILPLLLVGLYTAFSPERSSSRRARVLGIAGLGATLLPVLLVVLEEPVMAWMLD